MTKKEIMRKIILKFQVIEVVHDEIISLLKDYFKTTERQDKRSAGNRFRLER